MIIPVIEHIETAIENLVIEKLSPSNFAYMLKGCKYKFLLSQIVRNNPEYALPVFPKALIGIVAHKIIEMRFSGEITTEQEFELQWSSLIKEKELENYGQSDTGLLVDWMTYYKTMRYVFSIPHIEPDKSKPKTTEVGIWDIDYLYGSIDRIIKTDEGIEIIDYKTGEIYEEDGRIKQAYNIQLKLYAVMYQKKYNESVSKLMLRTIDGQSVMIDFSQDELEDLYLKVQEEIKMLKQKDINKLIKCDLSICSNCSVRHLCASYWQNEIADSDTLGKLKVVNDNNLVHIEQNGKINTVTLPAYSNKQLTDIVGSNIRIVSLSKPRDSVKGKVYDAKLWSRVFVVKENCNSH
jgi:CRISPR/Cas system-associated exonuclease Cas4 (RecB family)